jgi:hypothetical protein
VHLLLIYIVALQIEWCKARASVHQWIEEVVLLEEMRWVKEFLAWHGNWWEDEGSRWRGYQLNAKRVRRHVLFYLSGVPASFSSAGVQ